MHDTKNLHIIINNQPIKTTKDILYKNISIKSPIKKNFINNIYMCDICNGEPATENIHQTHGLLRECWFCWNY